ncbi:MAG: c-type cytochrome, partial [Acidobacteriota bacterium]|nr:c-type cytochrome [Acidobacteriota bacterium]
MKRILQPAVLAAFGLVCLFSSLHGADTASPITQNQNASQSNRDASVLFAKNCATCHGSDGRARTFKAKFNHARNLTDPQWQAGATDERLFNSISNGKGKMPAWGRKLSKVQINALVAYV